MTEPTTISAVAREWLLHGQQGISSRAMFNACVFGAEVDVFAHPHDLADWLHCERCRLTVPEVQAGRAFMATQGPIWRRLTERWEDIRGLLGQGRIRDAGAIIDDAVHAGGHDPAYGVWFVDSCKADEVAVILARWP